MYNQPRAATIKATTKGSLWAMERTTFRRILLKSACKKRKMYESLLEKVPMLKTLEVSNISFTDIVFVVNSIKYVDISCCTNNIIAD